MVRLGEADGPDEAVRPERTGCAARGARPLAVTAGSHWETATCEGLTSLLASFARGIFCGRRQTYVVRGQRNRRSLIGCGANLIVGSVGRRKKSMGLYIFLGGHFAAIFLAGHFAAPTLLPWALLYLRLGSNSIAIGSHSLVLTTSYNLDLNLGVC